MHDSHAGNRPAIRSYRLHASDPALLLALLAVAVRLFFWYYTKSTWEDALITLKQSENAASGLGLTYNPGGPPVHGFTSPISALVPLFAEFVHRGSGLIFQKASSAVGGGLAVFLGICIVRRLQLPSYSVLLVGGYLAFEHQQILFGMAGMETQLVVAILLFSIYTLFDMKPVQVGTGLGLCMLARPDFFFWVAIVFLLVAWKSWRQHSYRLFAVTIGCFSAVYGPWVAFTTWYYGSPIPNTVWAKEFGYTNHWFVGLAPLLFLKASLFRIRELVLGGLGPAYAGNGTGFQFFADHGAICLLMLLFLVPCVRRVFRSRDLPRIGILSFVIVYALYYLFLMGFVFGWYTVPLAAVTILAIAIGLDALLKYVLNQKRQQQVGYGFVFAYLACIIVILPVAFRSDRNVQRYVEDGLRKKIGLYLASVMGPSQTFGCESLGYFGYYSRREVFDYPGLANPAVWQFERQNPDKRGLINVLDHFRPDYLLLRPNEYSKGLRAGNLWLRTDYEIISDNRVPPSETQELLFPADNIDLEFLVLRRK